MIYIYFPGLDVQRLPPPPLNGISAGQMIFEEDEREDEDDIFCFAILLVWADKKTRLQLFRTLFSTWLWPTYTLEDINGQMLNNNFRIIHH